MPTHASGHGDNGSDAVGGAPSAGRRGPLTPRHLEILALVARGRTNRQVGEELGISERTVRNHMREIQHRLSTSDRTHAVVVAIGRGWIPIPIEPEESLIPGSSPAPA